MRRAVGARYWVALAAVGASAGGCSAPIAADLAEREANEAVVALEASGVAATKEPDPAHEERWRVTVPRREAAPAVAVLQARGLPRPEAPGVLDALGAGSLVPSRSAEHARLVAGTSGELERSLLGIDGMLAARVHLAVPPRDALSLDPHPLEPSASVLLQHRGATPPVGVADVQRLVAGAVPGLGPERVSVVTTPVANTTTPAAGFARLGPIAVTRGSLGPLRWVGAGALCAQLLLLFGAVALWFKLRRTQRALEALRSTAEPEAER